MRPTSKPLNTNPNPNPFLEEEERQTTTDRNADTLEETTKSKKYKESVALCLKSGGNG